MNDSRPVDIMLLGLIREKDEAALSMLYDRRAGWVYSLALSIVKNVTDAEEVTQDVFFRVWEKAESFDESRGSINAWLATITRRMAIDKTRSKQFRSVKREIPFENNDGGNQLVSSQPVYATGSSQSGSGRVLVAALGNLRDPLREVMELAYYDGLSHSKIAERLDTPLGTVKSRIREAMTQLRQVMKA